jgi:hypothetical protein
VAGVRLLPEQRCVAGLVFAAMGYQSSR